MTTYGKLQIHLTPSNPQLGRVAMNCTVTEDQWLRIKAILMPAFVGPGGAGPRGVCLGGLGGGMPGRKS